MILNRRIITLLILVLLTATHAWSFLLPSEKNASGDFFENTPVSVEQNVAETLDICRENGLSFGYDVPGNVDATNRVGQGASDFGAGFRVGFGRNRGALLSDPTLGIGSTLGRTLEGVQEGLLNVLRNRKFKLDAQDGNVLSRETFERLANDPAKGKIGAASIEELRTGLAAERAGVIDRVVERGIPGNPLEAGFEFTTKRGLRVDVKAFRADSLLKPGAAQKFVNKFRAAPEVKILLDPRNLSKAELDTVIKRATDAGISRDRFIIVPEEAFGPIKVGSEIF